MTAQTQPVTLSPAAIFVVILVEGFVTIAVEMLTIRQLVTVVGNSVIITSLIIGFFLLFLALGYYQGGRYTQNYHQVLKRNFFVAALLLGVGLSYFFIQLFFTEIFAKLSSNGLIALVVYLLLITSPLVFFLGQTVPITTNLFRYSHHVGAISGKVLGLSTLGSFLGSVCTTLLLMNFLGVAWTIFSNFLLLAILIILLANFSEDRLLLIFTAVVTLIIWSINVGVEKRLFGATDNYADYQILHNVNFNNRIGNILNINNAPSSFVDASSRGFEYIELIKQILFLELKFNHQKILVLGAGGFSLSAQGNFGNQFIYVDIDNKLPAITAQGFLQKINGQFIHDDARHFLATTPQKYDAIISDVYSSRFIIPFHLLTREYFQAVKNALAQDGVAIFNIIANPTLRDNYSRRVDNTIRSIFNNCMTIPRPYGNQLANIIYLCSMPENRDKTVYTDNLNAAMVDIYQLTRNQ